VRESLDTVQERIECVGIELVGNSIRQMLDLFRNVAGLLVSARRLDPCVSTISGLANASAMFTLAPPRARVPNRAKYRGMPRSVFLRDSSAPASWGVPQDRAT